MTLTKYFVLVSIARFYMVEALEELADIVLQDRPEKAQILAEVKAITDRGVNGEISFNKSLNSRLALIKAHRDHLTPLVARLKQKVSVSIARNRDFFRQFKGQVYIVSNGFCEFIRPVVAEYDIDADHVLANTLYLMGKGYRGSG